MPAWGATALATLRCAALTVLRRSLFMRNDGRLSAARRAFEDSEADEVLQNCGMWLARKSAPCGYRTGSKRILLPRQSQAMRVFRCERFLRYHRRPQSACEPAAMALLDRRHQVLNPQRERSRKVSRLIHRARILIKPTTCVANVQAVDHAIWQYASGFREGRKARRPVQPLSEDSRLFLRHIEVY
jgi:hypothetical protein